MKQGHAAALTVSLAVLVAIASLLPARAALRINHDEAREIAEEFLKRLDSGETDMAYELLNPSVRQSYALEDLAYTNRRRQSKGAVKRVFVKIGQTTPMVRGQTVPARARTLNQATSNAIVCFFEPPAINFRTASYTAVTVGGRPGGQLWVDNFQTTSEPSSACR